ncbi:MAG TPA: DUF4159 domain-containing protein [Steroidobacteraceae bacterium]|jgi:hypothetical protein|nr:DUF4159 domain-containing protein [Steroidobacteraceae bacterium]
MPSSRLACLALLAIGAVAALAAGSSAPQRSAEQGEFHFARLIYTDLPQYGRFRGGWWQQDWPEAETHFLLNLRRLTRVNAGEPVTVQLTDDTLFDYPWLYATQVGYWDLGDEEIARLREYLLRGGFLMADDYWGEGEREVFDASMARVFPDRQIVDIKGDDAVLHVVFSVDEFTQIPGLRHLGYGRIQSLPAPRWRGIYDDRGRLMVAMNYNQDVGDSWEEANNPQYPEPMTALGYRFGINYVTYAMTH